MAGGGEATFKSNILVREGKGFFGIPFKRIMLAFMSGALIYMISNFIVGGFSLVLGVTCGVLTVILTGPRGGIPLWQRLMYRLRGWLIMAQVDAPDSTAASLGKLLELHTDALVFSGDDLFRVPDDEAEVVDWSEWLAFTDPAQARSGDALQIVEGPVAPVERVAPAERKQLKAAQSNAPQLDSGSKSAKQGELLKTVEPTGGVA